MSQVSINGLPFNGALTQIPGNPSQPPPHAPHPTPQLTMPCSRLPALPEDRFNALFVQFSNATGLRLNARDFVIDGQPINPWALHRAVFARDGFDSVAANHEWPAVGATLGLPLFSAGDLTQPPRSSPAIAHQLQQLYNDSLRHFEQVYINNVLARLRLHVSTPVAAQPSQQQAQQDQPTYADYPAPHSGGESIHGTTSQQQVMQFIQFLRSQVAQGLLTREQAQERLASLQTSAAQAPHPPPQQTIQCSKLPALPEDRFKVIFAQFANITGLRLNAGNFVIGGRPINLWAFHRAVFARNGFDFVTANHEWPVVGAALGFPSSSAGDLTQPPRCAPAIAHRLQQLYNDSMRQFEQAYVNNLLARLRSSQALRQRSAQPSQQQSQPQQPTDADFLQEFSHLHLGPDQEDLSGHRSGSNKDSEGGLLRTSEEDSNVWS